MARYPHQLGEGVKADSGCKCELLLRVCVANVLSKLVDNDRDQLKTMEERNANLERDVLRYKERQALEKRVWTQNNYPMMAS